MKVFFHTLGCKVNQYETQEMKENLRKNGYTITENADEADIFVVNSCTVTSESDRKTRQCVRHFKNKYPQSIVVLTGCMPQSFPKMAENLVEAQIVLGNINNNLIVLALQEYFKTNKRVLWMEQHSKGEKFKSLGISDFDERTRAIIKIQDGCDRYCSYCIIPKSRGFLRSKPIENIKSETEKLAQKGYKEIVLVGINLTSYGRNEFDLDLADACMAVAENPKIERVRLGSLEPDHLTDELIIKLSKCEKLCPQFHISLQSGCDKILKTMNRHYTTNEYERLCTKLRECFKDCALTTDIMVGFPFENDDDFIETTEFAKKIAFEKIHIFPYSRRSGTVADKMEGQVERCVKTKRAKYLSNIATEIRNNFLSNQIGKTLSVIIESQQKNGNYQGYTANYTPVEFTDSAEIGSNVQVKITGISGDSCFGEIVK